jgi:hypothetical protein
MLDGTQAFTIYASPVGVDEGSSNAISIYPNPVKDVLHIECGGIKEISIYNSVGKLIGQYKNADAVQIIDMGNLPNGIYLLQLKNQNEIITRKLVKH